MVKQLSEFFELSEKDTKKVLAITPFATIVAFGILFLGTLIGFMF